MSERNKYILSIQAYRCYATIGAEAYERESKQKISYDIHILFNDMPLTCESDNLEQTYCYGNICNIINMVSTEKEYKSLEHLTYCSYNAIKKTIGKMQVNISTTKISPPIEGLENGATFCIKEF